MIKRVTKRINKIGAGLALLSVEIIVVLVLFLVALLLFVYMVKRVFVLHNYDIDQRAFAFLQPYVNDTTNKVMLLITYMGTHYFLIPANIILIAYFIFVKPHKWYSIKVPAISISSLLLMFALKMLFSRPRPLIPLLQEAKGMSFPSGHALMSVTFYGLIGYMVWHTRERSWLKIFILIALFLLVVMIGFSRVYLRVHYMSDVIAGFCMGFLWLVFSILTVRKVERYSKRNVDPVVEKDKI